MDVKNLLKEQIHEALNELENIEVHVNNPVRSSELGNDSEEGVSEPEATT
jgi:hypothetical protein